MTETSGTCWSLIENAAAGQATARESFAARYTTVVRAYLLARWRGSGLLGEIDDAIQEVFVECFRSGGALEKAEPRRRGGFRAFLFGVTRNVGARIERSQGRRETTLPSASALEADGAVEEDLRNVFDRAWALECVHEAIQRLGQGGRDAELLRLRFQEGLPIRDIASRWDLDAAAVHHDYARARRAFQDSLREVVAFHLPGSPGEVGAECRHLLTLLQ